MKRLFGLFAVLVLLSLAAGCAQAPDEPAEDNAGDAADEMTAAEPADDTAEETAVAEKDAAPADEEGEYVVEPIEAEAEEAEEETEEPFPGYTQSELDNLARKNIYPMDISDPRQHLSLGDEVHVKRISTDRGELRSLTFTVRNIRDEPIDVEVKALFFGFEVNGKPSKVEKEFNIPQIPPGFKFTKKFPQTIYFEDIEETKTIELYLKEKYTSPSTITETVKRDFVPYDEFETLEITW